VRNHMRCIAGTLLAGVPAAMFNIR
jgi:hypothetical protein